MNSLSGLAVLKAALKLSMQLTNDGYWAIIEYPFQNNKSCAGVHWGQLLSNGEREQAIQTTIFELTEKNGMTQVNHTHP